MDLIFCWKSQKVYKLTIILNFLFILYIIKTQLCNANAQAFCCKIIAQYHFFESSYNDN